MRVLVTGYTGFLGAHLFTALADSEAIDVLALGRKKVADIEEEKFIRYDFGKTQEVTDSLKGVNVIVHCAARAHVMREEENNPLAVYRKINTVGTLNLAKQAERSGVKRFIFISTIKVNGEETTAGIPFSIFDRPKPIDPYGISKYEAEKGLLELAKESAMEIVIIRPPLIYGPGVKANFLSMMKLTKKFLPLPFSAITQNKRSMVSIYNIVDLIICCIKHPGAANQVFLVSDDDDLSTKELFSTLKEEQNGKSILFAIPISILNFLAMITRTKKIMVRLTGSLQVDIEHTKEILNWTPPFTFREGIKKTLSN